MIKMISRNAERKVRQARVRKTVKGTALRPRLCVYKSLDNVYASIIDDDKNVTLVSVSTLSKDIKSKGSNVAAAKEVGTKIAEMAKAKNITQVVFDRNGYAYHGKVEALAQAARDAGLEF